MRFGLRCDDSLTPISDIIVLLHLNFCQDLGLAAVTVQRDMAPAASVLRRCFKWGSTVGAHGLPALPKAGSLPRELPGRDDLAAHDIHAPAPLGVSDYVMQTAR